MRSDVMRTPWVPVILVALGSISSASQTERGSALTRVDVQDMVDNVSQLLTNHYVFPDVAARICETLRRNMGQGEYDVATYDALAERLSRDLKTVNQDLHLNVWSIPPNPRAGNTEQTDLIDLHLNTIRRNAEQSYEFVKAEILEGNVGYLELTRFKAIPDPGLERVMSGAMAFLSSCSAMILDLRRNTGGNDRMIREFMSYFFDTPVPLTGRYERATGGVKEFSTRAEGPQRRLSRIPLFVLVSSRTISGPEQVAYDLQVLKRATIIGEKTRGAANPSRFFRIKEKLLVCIPTGYAVNPLTRTNWEGRGVTPDVIVAADSAMATATALAREAAEKARAKERDRVDGLVLRLKERMRQVESLLGKDAPAARRLFQEILDEYDAIEYMDQYLLLDWLDSYEAAGNLAACEMIATWGLRRYPEDERFCSRLGDVYVKRGELQKALESYSNVLRLYPNDLSTRKKIEKISRLR